jgi:hypothetical protein
MSKSDYSSRTYYTPDEYTVIPKYLSEPSSGKTGTNACSERSKQNPDHYQLGSIQVWDFIIDQDLDFILGNVVKYVCRAGTKPGESRLDDLKKAQAYINKAISTCTDV